MQNCWGVKPRERASVPPVDQPITAMRVVSIARPEGE